jgi:predicted AAA+ superfamily ATPase
MNITLKTCVKFDHNNINIRDYVEIIKFYNKFEKSTLFKEKVLNHEFDKEKLINYINKRFKDYSFDNSIFIYNIHFEILDFDNICLVILETVKDNKNIIFIVEHILS